MKKIMWVLSLTSVMAGMIFTGCNDRNDKWDDNSGIRKDKRYDRDDNVFDDKNDLNKRTTTVTTTYQTEWTGWREDAMEEIAENEERIDELKAKMDKAGPKRDERLAKRIGELREENRELRQRVLDYRYTDDNGWQDFKREFKHDMDELGRSLEDIGNDNVKDTK
jgi:hypothetical protein